MPCGSAGRLSVGAMSAFTFECVGGAGNSALMVPLTSGNEAENDCITRESIAKIVKSLQSSVSWDKRIQAMQQFEALVRGGAFHDASQDLLRDLREPLTQQLSDRYSPRSAQSFTFAL